VTKGVSVARSRSRIGISLLFCTALCVSGYGQEAGQSSGPANPGSPTHADTRDRNLYEDTSVTSGPVYKRLATNILLDQKDIWTSPFHINRSTAKWWLIVGAGTAALIAADHPISQALPRSGTSVSAGTDLSRLGQWYSVFPFAGGLYAVGRFTDNPKLEETGALSVQALVDAGIVFSVLKVLARRQRPGDGDYGGHFEKGGSSFPSGHSTESWALASVIAHEYGDHRWVPFAAYGFASVVSTSRLLGQEHFTSDVFVGGAIGFFIGRYVVHTNELHLAHSRRAKWLSPAISPIFDQDARSVGGRTVAVNLHWQM
jgi:membrane-associated phospholipid phosphatase